MTYKVPLIIRGRIVDGPMTGFGGRSDGVSFETPDVRDHLDELVLGSGADLADVHALSSEEILDFLHALGRELAFEKNPALREACALACACSGLARETVEQFYQSLGRWFDREFIRELVENGIGIKYLDGWVPHVMRSGTVARIRAIGARNVQILAGNVPVVAALSVLRNAMSRSDAILKTPSNDPITAAAIARTMAEMAPNHPLTRHLSVAYWKGGDAVVEDYLYRPDRIEKIIAWGGGASISHITRYMQPGIDQITLDPKLSQAIIGREAFTDEARMREVAHRLAIDIACYNQQACANARVVYVETGHDPEGIALANRFGAMLYEAILALPPTISGPARRLPTQLHDELQTLRIMSFDHKLYGGGVEGGVIVSQSGDPVDFAPILSDRVANLVPIDNFDVPVASVTAYTQTIGIYPDDLKEQLRDRLALAGAQRTVSLGFAMKSSIVGPHDGMEPFRRMCKWIVDETNDPALVSFFR